MKKYYMRAGKSPFDNFSAYETLMKDSIGGNSGNMLFVHSMFRALMTDENTLIDVNYNKFNIQDCDRINETYDAFVIPMANAFRPKYPEWGKIIPFIDKLKIPCIVTGVGVQLPYEPELNNSYVFDDDVKLFCKKILDKSASIGVRGEITAKYLEKLGFKNHIRVIGCPSMFMRGPKFELKKANDLSFESKICFNGQLSCEKNVWDFFERSFRQFLDYYYIGQGMYDLKNTWAGVPTSSVAINYPINTKHSLLLENRMRFFINTPSWLDFLSQMDFSVGVKIHGTVAALMAGIPAFIFVSDSRTRELAEFHEIPHMKSTDVDRDTTVYSLYRRITEENLLKGYSEKFQNFVSFLNENGLENIYEKEITEPVFDKKIKSINFYPGVESILHMDIEEQAERLDLYWGHMNRKIASLTKRK